MAVIDRTDAGALIPEDAAKEIIKATPATSLALSTFRQVPMSRKQKRMPVMSALPVAYWVDGDTGRKQTSDAGWDNVYMTAEELAVIVPIPEAVLDDTDYDIWGELKPAIAEAFGKAVDAAVLFGDSAPLSWPSSLCDLALAAGNTLEREVGGQALWEDIFGETGVLSKVERDGFDADFALAPLSFKGALRGQKDDNGRPIFTTFPGMDLPMIGDQTIRFSKNGAWNANDADLIVGDSTKAIIGIRQDLTYKILTEAVIQDSDGSILYNLAQQDMVALRCVMRVGYAVANPVNRINTNASTRCPFGVLGPKTGAS